MSKKAVFFDIDGTLYNYRTGIIDSTKEALERLKANGHYAFICTGRTLATIYDPELLSLGFDGIAAGCGTYVELQGEKLLNYEISRETLMETLKIFEEHRITPVLEGVQRLYYHGEDYLKKKRTNL